MQIINIMKQFYIILCLACLQMTFGQPTDDDCANAELITIDTSLTSFTFEIIDATINNELGCTTTDDYADVWYEFVMPVNGNLFIDGVTRWNDFGLYEDCGGNLIQCGTNDEFVNKLTSGTTYKLRVFREAHLADNGFTSFGLQAFEEVTNDTCATAETITVTSTEELTYSFNIGGAEVLNEIGCDSTEDYVDIWYEFTMPVNGNLFINGVSSWNNFALYDACNGNMVQCGTGNQFISRLTSGTNYKLRVFRIITLADNGFTSFGIQAFEGIPNDTCDNADIITVNTTEITSYEFTISGAEVNNEMGCDSTLNDYVDIWYEFTMPVNGNLFINGVTNWNNFGLYDACTGNLIQCGEADEFIEGLTSGTTYKLRVFRASNLADNDLTSFGLRAFEMVTNDTCATAESLTVTENSIITINFEIGGATVNNETGCTTGINEDYVDIWYSFEMPVNGDIKIDCNTNWNNFAIFDNCNANTSLACFEESGTVTNLSANNTYWIRVFRNRDLADNTADTNFNISIVNSLSTATFTNTDVRVFPNPTNNIINIHSNKSFHALELYNIKGKKIISVKCQNKLSIGSLESGIYILKIKSQQNKQVIKRIVIN
jgi:hypothetical protein